VQIPAKLCPARRQVDRMNVADWPSASDIAPQAKVSF
jgi:hypothetical protein